MKAKKLKTYVIMVSVNFPKLKNSVTVEKTLFKDKILDGIKKHTIRSNYDFWKKRIDEINAGRAILSVRQWKGIPYYSKQKEIKQFVKDELSYQRISVIINTNIDVVTVSKSSKKNYPGEDKYLGSKQKILLAKNDGLTFEQFRGWFKKGLSNGIIIHWTKFKY
jgi:hypothetical protein